MNSIVKRALSNYEYAKSLPLPDFSPGRWETLSGLVDEQISNVKTPLQAQRVAERDLPFTHLMRPFESDKAVWPNLVYREFPWFGDELKSLAASKSSWPGTAWISEGRKVNNMFFWHARSLFACLTHTDAKSVLEIGGGYGSLARLWLLNQIKPCERYVIVDLPQSLFFAECVLGLEFDDIGYFRDTMPDTKIVLVPISNLPKFKERADIVVNIGSMQEMSDAWVDFYMRWLDTLESRWFYSLNYCGQPMPVMGETRSYWSPRPSRYWRTRLINADPPLVANMCSQRYFAEILYERSETTVVRSLAEWSVLQGGALTRDTYIEGLELVRQSPDTHDAMQFVNRILQWSTKVGQGALFKELYLIASSIDKADVSNGKEVAEALVKHVGGWKT